MALSDAERTLYEARLLKAENARHDILTGKGIKRFVDQNGEQIEYSATNIERLESYIRELRELLNPALACYSRSRPLGFLF